MPEELDCARIAADLASFDKMARDPDFIEDWDMLRLVDLARQGCGALEPGTVYHLVIPAVLGGRYDADNFRSISLSELVAVSGDMAQQIANLPDGAQVTIKVVE